jgi:hypothetical protein
MKSNHSIGLVALLACLLVMSCEKDTEPAVYMPALATNSASDLTRFAATLSGTVATSEKSTAQVDIFFRWAQGTSLTDYEEVEAVADNATPGRYTCAVDGLLPGDSYCYAICARSGGSVAQGDIITFETAASDVPVLGATATADVTESGVQLSSSVSDNGGSNISARGFVYKVYVAGMPEPTTSDKMFSSPATDNAFSVGLTGLQASTTYIVRAYAINNRGTGYGASTQFTTGKLLIPSLTCDAITPTATTAEGTVAVSRDNQYPVTEYGYCYSAESQVPTVENLKTVVGTADVGTADAPSFNGLIENLDPETTYYLRAYAVNAKGTGYSNIITFTTQARQVVTLTLPVVSDLSFTSVTLGSTLTIPTGVDVSERGFCYSLFSTKPAIDGTHVAVEGSGNSISLSLSDLVEGATYYATAYAVTRDGTWYSEAAQFTLERTFEPTVGIDQVTDLGETEATIHATIGSDGGRAISARGICWSSTTSTPTLEDNTMEYTDATRPNNITLTLTGLDKGQKYYVRAYATNVNGTGYSPAYEFTTALTTAPEVVDLTVLAIHDDHATAQALISDRGGLAITERGFVYSTTVASPTLETDGVKQVISSSTDDAFTAELTGLTYHTPYYISAYATNAKGTSYSSSTTFFTSSTTVPGTSIVSVPDSVVGATTVVLSGRITTDGGDGSEALTIGNVGFCWSDSNSSPTLEDGNAQATLNADGTFTLQVTGLKAYTYYYARAYATNKNGTGYSYYTTFRTLRTDPGGDDNNPPGIVP